MTFPRNASSNFQAETSRLRSSSSSRADQQTHRILHVVLPQVGEPRHCDAVENAMIRGPADRHDVSRNHVSLVVESRHLLRPSERADYHLRRQDHRLRVRSTDLESIRHLLIIPFDFQLLIRAARAAVSDSYHFVSSLTVLSTKGEQFYALTEGLDVIALTNLPRLCSTTRTSCRPNRRAVSTTFCRAPGAC